MGRARWPRAARLRHAMSGGGRRRRRNRDRESRRDRDRLGRGQRRAGVQCHRLAGQPYPGHDGAAEGRGSRGHDPRARRPAARPLLLRLEAQVDPRQRARCSAARRSRAPSARHERRLLSGPGVRHLRHRRHHGLAHQPHEPGRRAVGRRIVPLVRRAHRVAPADPLDGGRVRTRLPQAVWKSPRARSISRRRCSGTAAARRDKPRSRSAPVRSRWP